MAKFLSRGDNPETYYSQANNAVEAMLKKAGVKSWLESCGPTAATMLVDAIGKSVRSMTPGGWSPQAEDVLTAWFNDPRNADEQKQILGDWYDHQKTFGNEVAELYPVAIAHVFGVKARIFYGAVNFGVLVGNIDANIGVQVCLKNPGHFVAVVGYDSQTQTVIYNDPWPNNQWPIDLAGTPGFNRKLPWNRFGANLKDFVILIG